MKQEEVRNQSGIVSVCRLRLDNDDLMGCSPISRCLEKRGIGYKSVFRVSELLSASKRSGVRNECFQYVTVVYCIREGEKPIFSV
jgi:hypothetical protein